MREAYSRDAASARRKQPADRQNVRRDGSYASAYSRESSSSDYAKQRKRGKRRKVVIAAVIVVLLVLVGGAGAAFAYMNSLSSNIHEGIDADLRDALVKTNLTKEPFYMLLMGTDGSAERAESDEYAGDPTRSDSIMLARIDPVDKKATLISLHRDTYVELEGYGPNKLNAAYAFGGQALAVKTVSKLAGVPISHYAEVNFDGFRDVVNALGGVEVDVPVEIDDPDAGGYVAAGPQTINGDQALILCRSRHTYDEYGDGDSYRAANQRMVLGAIAKKILSSDVATMANTVNALSKYITTDLDIMDVVGLAQAMRGLDPATDLYTAMQPTTPSYVGGVWYEYTDTQAWKTMMSRVDQGLPPYEAAVIDEATGTVLATSGQAASGTAKKSGTVTVKNGSGKDGAAASAAAKVQALGYTVTTGNANSTDYPKTLVVYESPAKAGEAQEIVGALGVGSALQNDGTYVFDGNFLVVIGADWQ